MAPPLTPRPTDLADAGAAFRATAERLVEDQAASLRTLVDAILGAPFPMFVLLGPEHRMIYNSAYIPILGPHHPAALGQPFLQVWGEVRDEIAPVIARALAGEASLFEDLPVVLHRPTPEQAWFTFSYSPVRSEDGSIAGALCVCTETTDAVRARQRQSFLIDLETALRHLEEPLDIVAAAQAALGRYLGVSRVGYGSVDAGERYFTTSGNWTDGSVPHHDGTHDLAAFGDEIFTALRRGDPLVVDDTFTDPRSQSAQAAAAFAALQVRSAATVSLIKAGRFVAALYVHHHQPRTWTSDEMALIHDVAERTWSAVERAHAQADLRTLARRQAFLLALGDELRSLADAERIKEVAGRMLGEHLGAGRAGYGEIDAQQAHVTVERDWSSGELVSLGGETRPLDIFGPAIIDELRAGRILRIDSIEANPVSAPYAEGYASIGARALLVVPLIKDGRFTAILYLHESSPRAWSDEDAAIASEVAERTWAAVERARAEQDVRALNATLEQRVDEALAERKLFADLVATTDSPIQMIDRDFRFIAINPAAQDSYARVFGVTPLVGQSLIDILGHMPEQLRLAREVWQRALNGEAFEQTAWWGDGTLEKRAFEMRFRPLLGRSGEIVGAYLLGREITELLREQERVAAAEEQLRHAQKMEAMGQLTGGVAHDFNNLLTPIVGSLDMLQRKQLGSDREQRLIGGAAEAAERAKLLVQRLLAFARRQPLQPSAVDLRELVEGMTNLIASTTGPQIRVSVDIADGLPAARADQNQLEMALLNLAVNARDAMPDGGTLHISAASEKVGKRHRAALAPGSYVRLSVADTGIGMDEETLKRAVEPFFSTKGVGKGTGLGLSMVHGLALQLGGALTIDSAPGAGTTIALWLPPSDEAARQAHAPNPAPAAASGSGLVLLVDDEDVVRMSTADMLSELGYAVVEAASAEAALRLVEDGLRPALMVTDHLMAGMNGTELARSVREIDPAVAVLVISGYAELDDAAPDFPRLTKPFRAHELAASLAEL